jgi:tetratricopeptide (TPR) repeat protein
VSPSLKKGGAMAEEIMDLKLKTISRSCIPEAISKATLYRYLNEPEETESICHDILAADPENQVALRTLGAAITDQFTGNPSDRYAEAEGVIQRLSDPYERQYYTGLIYERRAKAQMRIGRPPQVLIGLFKEAMHYFAEAEKIRPPDNDDAVLRWNRCVRLLEAFPQAQAEQAEPVLEDHDIAPVEVMRRNARVAR